MSRNREVLVAVGIAIAVMLFASGFWLTYLSPQSTHEMFTISGYVTIEAYHGDGTLYAKWEGLNALEPEGKNFIAACASGIDPNPYGVRCTGPWVNNIQILQLTPDVRLRAAAVNTRVPGSCNPDDLRSFCTGWMVRSTFEKEITQTFTINLVWALAPSAPEVLMFSTAEVRPPVTVNPGDRLVVTINYSVGTPPTTT